MTRSTRFGLAAAALLLALLAALYAAPRLTDWTARRDQLALIASGWLGMPVSLSGPVRLELLPRPMLEAEGVAVGGPEDSLTFGARALRLRLDGWSLLLGRLAPREVSVVGADIRLPWPPVPSLDLAASLSSFAAEVVEGRVTIGSVVLEQVRARLSAGAYSEALRAEGTFTAPGVLPGREVRFSTTLGRPGFDGAVPLDLTLTSGGASLSTRGLLPAGGGLEGMAEASGPDLSLLLPGPPGPFRAQGRLTASSELIVADELNLDVAGSPARGALTLRLRPAPRLDVALAAGRLELEPWLANLRGGSGIPFGLDLSAEAASWRGIALRRLRASVFREGDRLSLTDGSAILPGDTTVEMSGATAAGRLESVLHFEGADLRTTLAALGYPLPSLAPGRLRRGEGRARLVLEEGQASLPELAATIDGTRLSGAGVLRRGARPALGLGLTLDTLDLDGLWAPGRSWEDLSADLAAFDANLRLSADAVRLHGLLAERTNLDAALENGRLTVRQAAGRLAGLEATASGGVLLGPSPRLADLSLEASGPDAHGLLELLPGSWPDDTSLAGQPVTLWLTGNGAPDALALRLEADWAEVRLEGTAALNLPARRGTGALTLRHPGAPRLLSALLGPGKAGWLGDGSLSLVLGFAANAAPGALGLAADRFELVAGTLRGGGQLALGLGGDRPRLTGRLALESLPLLLPDWRDPAPLPLGLLRAMDAELALGIGRAGPWGLPVLEEAEGALVLKDSVLRIGLSQGRLGEGQLEGSLALDASGALPRLSVSGQLAGAAVTEALQGPGLTLSGGRLGLQLDVAATGNSPAAMLATLGGTARLSAVDGSLAGLDARGAVEAARTGGGEAEAALRAALGGGETHFATLDSELRLEQGRAVLGPTRLLGEGVDLSAQGEVDLARAVLDLLLSLHPAQGPEIGLRLTGSLAQPRRVPELAPWLRWRAEQGG
ncbi:AsmA family protein [Roseomonas sp. OT10]|uniref:AsmA family protein n=1 Tax=Roseomonas cutis TaxID=2897332 RepID=UPI001E40692B|nr:AsmA-like C-terminal region-containing protein [Roseomonas sp. OT10]UFN47400.1 AsmA family protein [Roseomonas sp. OT10]